MLFQVRHVKQGVNPASANEIFFSGKYLGAGIRIGVIAGMVALTVSIFQFPTLDKQNSFSFHTLAAKFLKFQEAVAIGRTFAAMKDYALDGNKEMIAMGAMNIAGSLTSCYVATGTTIKSCFSLL